MNTTQSLRDSRGRFVKNSTNGNGAAKSGMDFETAALLGDFVHNAETSRRRLLTQLTDSRRDIGDECGYPKTNELTPDDYRGQYDRNPIAARVVEILPDESWNIMPQVFEDENMDNETEFEKAWKDVGKNMRGKSWFKDDKGHPCWEVLHRADRLSGIGSYGILLLGFDDGLELHEPVESKAVDPDLPVENQENRKLIFVRAFDESTAQITQWETDKANSRFGQPNQYLVTFNDPDSDGRTGVGSQSTTTAQVHWSRVIHIADNLDSSEIFGPPRMRPVFNRLYDLDKVFGSDAEGFWKNVIMRIFFESSSPQLGTDVKFDIPALRTMMEEMENGLQRWAAISGGQVKTVAPSVVNPREHIDVQIDAICIKFAIPKRIFVGSERGELASSQDAKTWHTRMQIRRHLYINPRIIVPFIDRLIMAGTLPEPKDGYGIHWPVSEVLSEKEQMEIAKGMVEAMVKYVSGGVDVLFPPLDFLTRILKFDEDDAEAVLKEAEKVQEAKAKEEAEQQKIAMEAEKEMMAEKAKLAPAPVPPPVPGEPPAEGAEGAVPAEGESDEEKEIAKALAEAEAKKKADEEAKKKKADSK